jgi:hypothetical protein
MRSTASSNDNPLRKMVRVLFAFAVVWSLGSSARPQSVNSNSVTVESFLQHAPVIRRLAFQETIVEKPAQVRNCLLVIDGSNFLYQADGDFPRGRFNGIFWRFYAQNNLLVLADPAINDVEIRNGSPAAPLMRKFLAWEVAEVLNLGFREIDRDADVVLDKEHNRLLVTGNLNWPDTKLVKMALQFNREEDHIVSATLSTVTNTGADRWASFTTFSYDKSFCDGHFPVELTRYAPSTSVDNIEKFQWVYRIRFKELELSTGPIADREIDPKQVFASKSLTIHFWSNNAAYAADADGGVRPVLDAVAMFKKNGAHAAERRLHPIAAAMLLILLLILSPAVWLVHKAWRGGKQLNNKREQTL